MKLTLTKSSLLLVTLQMFVTLCYSNPAPVVEWPQEILDLGNNFPKELQFSQAELNGNPFQRRSSLPTSCFANLPEHCPAFKTPTNSGTSTISSPTRELAPKHFYRNHNPLRYPSTIKEACCSCRFCWDVLRRREMRHQNYLTKPIKISLKVGMRMRANGSARAVNQSFTVGCTCFLP